MVTQKTIRVGVYSALEPHRKVSTYCDWCRRRVEVAKWYRGHGDPAAVSDPDVFMLVCKGIKIGEMYQRPDCGHEQMGCPELHKRWSNERKKLKELSRDGSPIRASVDK